ncbi:hypothetical protein [Flavobacterium tibetense]|uniref:Uncharacterized protein n=1 Tax=Flavobacterium tibetense TaxID=2233533 RepID=A0A365P099_9FLAO|nr:hypothetical protein [Flavobacterium tibetense]RBA27936.1 hypothetical protein DPN68_09605 [Flavobacterium tibetense]
MKRIIFVLIFTLFFSYVKSQEKIQNIIIPEKFDFFKEANQYNLNYLLKAFFDKEGFFTIYDSELSEDSPIDSCAFVYPTLKHEKNFFITKILVEIKDCNGNILLKSVEGTSRDKSYKKANNESLRIALNSLRGKLNFKAKTSTKPVVTVIAKKADEPQIIKNNEKSLLRLYSIPTQTGYKLVDEVPNVIFELTKSSSPDIFIAKKGNLQGLFVKKENNWLFEYNDGNQLISEKVDVKF